MDQKKTYEQVPARRWRFLECFVCQNTSEFLRIPTCFQYDESLGIMLHKPVLRSGGKKWEPEQKVIWPVYKHWFNKHFGHTVDVSARQKTFQGACPGCWKRLQADRFDQIGSTDLFKKTTPQLTCPICLDPIELQTNSTISILTDS